jgi:hypothetical protein
MIFLIFVSYHMHKRMHRLIKFSTCWGLVLKCYELRTRQHKMLNDNTLRPLKHYFPKDLMNFERRFKMESITKDESS